MSHAQELKDFSFTFLELPKFDKTIDDLKTMEEKWMYFFKHATETDPEELKKITGSDIVIRQAYDVLDQFHWSPEELRTYEREKKSQLDGQAMLLSAKLEGKAEGIKIVAKNMLAQGIDIHTIMMVTGLSKDEIE